MKLDNSLAFCNILPKQRNTSLGNDPRPRQTQGRLTATALLLALLLALLPGAATMQASANKVHPQLLALAETQPNQKVRISIQHSTTTEDMQATVIWLGRVISSN